MSAHERGPEEDVPDLSLGKEWPSMPPFFACSVIRIKSEKLRRASCDGRVVKALDLKSNGVSPRRFEPCSQRYLFYIFGTFL